MTASRQWASRPDEERFTSLPEMHATLEAQRAISAARVVSTRSLRAEPTADNSGLVLVGPGGHAVAPTHWAFGQLAQRGSAPAAYLRGLPAPLAADCLNWSMSTTPAEDMGVLLSRAPGGGLPVLRAATGPKYGRIWNADLIRHLMDRFGDGVSGDFRVPGIWGKALDQVSKDNTTLYAGDRDVFVFLADEVNRIELPDRRDGRTGSLARGFFVQNSEVGSAALRVTCFLFDFVCANRIVWGARNVEEISVRHSASAPDRFIEQVAPALLEYSKASQGAELRTLIQAQKTKLPDVEKFLANRFGPRVAQRVQHAHMLDEGRPIETLWDVVTGATAHARSITFQADRVEFERTAGALLDLVEA